ncbi:hypothetical protein [Hymenobacter terricola]|uniref:hypothetical protein n=1 Tax=Hymenobacter terricola TaxID=2819236 RepID=UPI001B30DB34|nr:hypothetical protein [Hymenobacter terricola]
MRFAPFLLIGLLASGRAQAQQPGPPPGAYRSAAAYRHRQPRPAGTDAFYPDKRGQLVVVALQGARSVKLRVAPDSVWGYVSGKGHTVRFYRGQEYQLEHADTLCVYSSTTVLVEDARMGPVIATPGGIGGQTLNTYTPRYFFSLGLSGLIFPLTPRYLRELYAASNPRFAGAVSSLRIDQSLTDFDRKTGFYRVTTLYQQSVAGH